MMKKYFRVICVILACLLLLPTLASCKNKTSDTYTESNTERKPDTESPTETVTETVTETETKAVIELAGEHAGLILN